MSKKISIKILDKVLEVRCPSEGEHNLVAAADQLNKMLQDGSNKNPSLSKEKLIMLTALNLSGLLLVKESEWHEDFNAQQQRMDMLRTKIKETLEDNQDHC